MPAVDRNILRLAVYEMNELKTPPAVVIDEALELARQFSGDESVAFINGVLDAVRREKINRIHRERAQSRPDFSAQSPQYRSRCPRYEQFRIFRTAVW